MEASRIQRSDPRQLAPPFSARAAQAASRLPRDFFNRDATIVARELLGKLLIRREGKRLLAGRIVENEAYLGAIDPASHAYIGRTPRNAVLFGPPGHAYVYFIYGMYFCTNVSCKPEGNGGGVLLRALEPVLGLEAMADARGIELPSEPRTAQLRMISSGPGRMSEALGITRPRDNDKDFTSARSDLWLADDGHRPKEIVVTARIGINVAVDEPLRFVIAHNPFVSGPKLR
jgi:DNA-3-methyladenine glycosylase